MAIFWNHIKGTGNASKNADGLWTWIQWSQSDTTFSGEGPHSMDCSSEILVSNSNGNPATATSLGKILTSNIDTNVSGIWNNYNSWNWTHKDGDTSTLVLSINPQANYAEINTPKGIAWNLPNKSSWTLQKDTNTKIINILAGINDNKLENNTWTSTLNITNTGTLTNTGNIFNTGNITTSGKCEASFFNATSDKRAKENIVPATFSGLDLINKLNVYTFNYKDTPGNVPGVLAQDLLEAQPEELDLVDNIAATGENGDYMSIKADKLIFVLMKAIKEQQQQIDELKETIQKLTK